MSFMWAYSMALRQGCGFCQEEKKKEKGPNVTTMHKNIQKMRIF